jgi:hypothetical protein
MVIDERQWRIGQEAGMTEAAWQRLIQDAHALRSLIGRQVRYLGQLYEITDIVLDEDLMILSADEDSEVQEDSYGRAHRLVPRQQSLRFRDAEGHPTNLWQDLEFIDGASGT